MKTGLLYLKSKFWNQQC